MPTDVIDLNAERNKREQPDPEFIRKDGFGRPLYCFGLSYEMDGSSWVTELWASDFDDAGRRVAAMRESLAVFGQIYSQGV